MTNDSVFDVLDHFLHPKPPKPNLSPKDRLFLDNFRMVVEKHRSDPEFTTTMAASGVGLSRMQLNRKLRTLTGKSTHDYILGKRLEDACTLLTQPVPISFIAESVGFRSSSHFAKAFREKFGTTPSAYRAKESLARQPTI